MDEAELSRADWRKSSYSAQNGNCVEVGTAAPAVLVRDTKDPAGSALAFAPGTWRRFAAGIKDADKA